LSIKEILKEAREEKGLSVEQVSKKLRINKKYIHAMEDGNFLVLPSLVYAKGFLKAYCELLDLDQKICKEELVQFFRPKEVPKKIQPQIKDEPKEASSINYVNITYAVAGISATLLLLFGIYSYFSSPQNYASHPEPAAVTEKAEKPAMPKAVAAKAAVAAKPAVKPPGVKVEALSNSWVSVSSNGVHVYSGTLEAGHWMIFRGQEVKVSARDGGTVRIYLNGVVLGPVGVLGQPAEKIYYPKQ
jgi:transcriptional regulator with XRE-family HTH domain